MLLISSWIEFWFVKFVPKYLNSSKLSKKLLSVFILWHRHPFCSRDMATYLSLSLISSSQIAVIHLINYHRVWGIKAKLGWSIRCREQDICSRVRIPGRTSDFFSKNSRPSLEVNQPHIQRAQWFCTVLNGPGSEIIHSLQYNADYRNKWSCISVLPLGFHSLNCKFNS
jgi:hypothetical protein